MVFVNLFREPLGRPVGYPNAKGMFDRLAKRAGFVVRPHLLRHTAAAGWEGRGVASDATFCAWREDGLAGAAALPGVCRGCVSCLAKDEAQARP